MLRNIFTISIRTLLREKLHSGLNLAGLTLGLASALLLLLYILDELSYDSYHAKAKNIYRISTTIQEPNKSFSWAVSQRTLAHELSDNAVGVNRAVRFERIARTSYRHDDKRFYEGEFYMVDSTLFQMFSHEFLAGDPHQCLVKPNSIVLTESVAKKYFGNVHRAISGTLENSSGDLFTVTAVIRNVPYNSHFRFDAVLSKTEAISFQESWASFSSITYIELTDESYADNVIKKLNEIAEEKVVPIFSPMGIKVSYQLQPLLAIHLHSRLQEESETGGDIKYVYIFTSVAVFIIIISCVNYMSISTARATKRAKEVGLRKALGSQRSSLIVQFLAESTILVLAAFILSIGLVYAMLPWFNTVSGKHLAFTVLFEPSMIVPALTVLFITIIIAGSYPAFVLSRFNPIEAVKGQVRSSSSSSLRRTLVVVQFSMGAFMLINTVLISNQLAFIRSRDLGFDKERLVRVSLTSETRSKADLLTERLNTLPFVAAVGAANSSPGFGMTKNLYRVEDEKGELVERIVDMYSANDQYFRTLGMQLVAGRNFSRDNPTDLTSSVIVNESMVSRMGWQDPIGKRVLEVEENGTIERTVIGVIRDYNQGSLYNRIEPLMVQFKTSAYNLFIKLSEGKPDEMIAGIEAVWKKLFPDEPLTLVFLDEALESQYTSDKRRSEIFTTFSGLTIVITCLGLLGLVAYTTEQRSREIAIRKVNGANVGILIFHLSREVLVLVSIGLAIGITMSFYFTDQWLQNFAYRIDLNRQWVAILLVVSIVVGVTAATIVSHVVRAATTNPVKVLRSE